MKLPEILQDKRNKILSVWIERTLDSYTSSGFFKKSSDKFANPIGANIKEGLTTVFDLLARGAAPEEFAAPVDKVIRIRAVQDFTLAQAVAPFLELKWIVRQIVVNDPKTGLQLRDLENLECEIDKIALTAFDTYTLCREQLHQVRIQELKSGRYVLTDTPCSSTMLEKNGESLTKIN